ncbi:MAG: type I restriction enzyme endonuclease domain-containing protein, partial [Thermoanaerobaculia bacterium]
KAIARELTRIVRKNATIDWSQRESARARLRLLVKGLLKKHGYPPDKRQEATDNVLAQAEKLGDFFVESEPEPEPRPERPFRIVPPGEVKPFENAVPVYDLKAAASGFSEEQQAEPGRFEWAELPDYYRPRPGLFVAQVVGESMNRVVPNGGWALFRSNPQGSREGKVVLVRHREIQDTDTGGHYTLKRYQSDKETAPDGTWRHTRIVLRPESDRDGYEPIVIEAAEEAELQVIAELIGVIS